MTFRIAEQTGQPRASTRLWQRVALSAASAFSCLIIGKLVLHAASFGPVASHMAQHILLMNLLAPATAIMVIFLMRSGPWLIVTNRRSLLAAATIFQLVLLWAWHAPGVLPIGSHDMTNHILMQATLFAGALWFWLELLSLRGAARWRALFALLLTGKLFCLLGVLLVFAPRLLYASPLAVPSEALADQHLAGLLMVIACPLTYVLAGIIIAVQWLDDITNSQVLPDAQHAR